MHKSKKIKSFISNTVLLKKDVLTKKEYNQIKNHKDFGDKDDWTFEPRFNHYTTYLER